MSAMTASGRHAARACLTCKTRKKKCSKQLPSCGYCFRKHLHCFYMVDAGPHRDAGSASQSIDGPPDVPTWGVQPSTHPTSCSKIPSAKFLSDTETIEDRQLSSTFQFSAPNSAPRIRFLSVRSSLTETRRYVYLDVYDTIRASGQFIDDITARYFQGFHRHLPIISRARFNNTLMTMGAAPTADFSALLLTMCLITHAPALGTGDDPTFFSEWRPLYLSAKSLLAQVQASCPPSLYMIQAGILQAVYEYIQQRTEHAFVTIAGIARIARVARIHTHSCRQREVLHAASNHNEFDLLLNAEEAANTWWGLVTYERIFLNESSDLDQRLITVCPGDDARLPIESVMLDQLDQLDISDLNSLPKISVSCLTSPHIGGFGRTAQATHLLDEVLRSFHTPDIDSRLLQLNKLDIEIQGLLSLAMSQCDGKPGFCTAINIAIRTLFTLHRHILDLPRHAISTAPKPLDEWCEKSEGALDTATKMVVAISEVLIERDPEEPGVLRPIDSMVDCMPPIYYYAARAAYRHANSRSTVQGEGDDRLESAKKVIITALGGYAERWVVP